MIDNSFREKRSYPRFPVMIPASCVLAGLEDKLKGHTRDISASGLGLFTCKELPLGSSLNITLRMVDNGEEIKLKGVVAWSAEFNGSGYRTGIRLEEKAIKPIPLVLRTIYR